MTMKLPWPSPSRLTNADRNLNLDIRLDGSLVKTVLALLMILFATASFAHPPPAPPFAPGCGTADTKFDVPTNDKQHPFAKRDAGKALIYLLQDDSDFLSRPWITNRKYAQN